MTIVSATVVIALLIAAVAALFVQRARAAELQQTAVRTGSDAVTATATDDFLQELTTVRTVGFESVDAARSSRQIVIAHVRQEKQAELEQIRRAAARATAAAQEESTADRTAGDGDSCLLYTSRCV